jgi:hypothetical protein
MKRCSNCFFIKSDSEFYPNRTAKHPSNRLQSYCKICKRETFRGWKSRRRDAERIVRLKSAEKYANNFLKRNKNENK